jgi:DNA-directed RNA polymerase sigma subunit (sigma70/sigma32)
MSKYETLMNKLMAAVAGIPENERKVIAYRFGLESGTTSRPIQDCVKKFKIPAETVRLYEARVLRRMRIPQSPLAAKLARI